MFRGAMGAAQAAQNLGALPSGADLKKATNTVSLVGGASLTGFILGSLIAHSGGKLSEVTWHSFAAAGVLWVLWYFTKE